MQSPSSYHICFLPRSQTGQVRRWVTLTQFPRSQSSHPNVHIFKTFGHSQTLRSTFRFRIVSLQPLDGFLPHCTHTTLGVVDVPFGGSWRLTYFMTYDLGQNNFAVNISFLDSATPWVVDGFLPYCTHTTLRGDVPFGVVTVDLFYDLRVRYQPK